MATPIDSEKNPPSGERMRLPAVPTVTSTTAAQVLASLKEIIEVREGRRGSKYEKAVTWRDLWELGLIGIQSGGKNVVNINMGPVQAINGIPASNTPAFRDMFAQFERELRNTTAFKKLNRLIGSVDDLQSLPDELRRMVSTSVLDEAQKRGAAIQQVQQVIQNSSLSFAAKVEEVTAAVQGAAAGVRRVDAAYATRTRALAASITTVEARLDDVGGVTIEEAMTAVADAVEGLEGTYTLRVNVNGKIAGFALGATATTSSAIFQVDKFGIYNGTSDVIIFGVDGSGVYINANVRVAGNIAANQITAGEMTTSSGAGVIKLGSSSADYILRVSRTGGTTQPAFYVFDNSASVTEAMYCSSTTTATFSANFICGTTTTMGVTSTNSSFSAAKFKNSAATKEVWLAAGAYSVYSPSGWGKHYAVDGLGPFTGFHDGLMPKTDYFAIGDIVVDEDIIHAPDVNNALSTVALSSEPNQKGAIGIVSAARDIDEFLTLPYEMWWDYAESHSLLSINGVGEGKINVSGMAGNIEKGDLIVTSAIPGKGQRQDDDIVRSKTVARAREAVTFTSPEEVRQIACIYLCG